MEYDYNTIFSHACKAHGLLVIFLVHHCMQYVTAIDMCNLMVRR